MRLGACQADLFFKKLDKTLKEWKKMKPLSPPKGVSPAPALVEGESRTPTPADAVSEGAATQATAMVDPAASSPAAAPAAAPTEQAARNADGHGSSPVDVSYADGGSTLGRFTIVSEKVVYKRFLQVEAAGGTPQLHGPCTLKTAPPRS